MNTFEIFVIPILILILLLIAVAWMAVWVAKAGQPKHRLITVILKAAIAPSILRVACLWYMFPGVLYGSSGLLYALLIIIGLYPEGVLLQNVILVSPKDGRWTFAGTLLLSLINTLSVVAFTSICAAIVYAIRHSRQMTERNQS